MPDGTEHNIAQLSMTQQCKWFGLRMFSVRSVIRKKNASVGGREKTYS